MGFLGWLAAIVGYIVLAGVGAVLLGRRLKVVRRRETVAVPIPPPVQEDAAIEALRKAVRGLATNLDDVERIANKALRAANSASGRIGHALQNGVIVDDDEPDPPPRAPTLLKGMQE
jgi:hypothetical protein